MCPCRSSHHITSADTGYCNCVGLPCTPALGEPEAAGKFVTPLFTNHALEFPAPQRRLTQHAVPGFAGLNQGGQLGDGTYLNFRAQPASVLTAGNSASTTFLAAGAYHSCVAVNFGQEPSICWG